jgi:hypothetical protein
MLPPPRWSHAHSLSEGPAEMGEVVEAAGECDFSDGLVPSLRRGQQLRGALDPLSEQTLHHRFVLFGKNPLQPSRRDAELLSDPLGP